MINNKQPQFIYRTSSVALKTNTQLKKTSTHVVDIVHMLFDTCKSTKYLNSKLIISKKEFNKRVALFKMAAPLACLNYPTGTCSFMTSLIFSRGNTSHHGGWFQVSAVQHGRSYVKIVSAHILFYVI